MLRDRRNGFVYKKTGSLGTRRKSGARGLERKAFVGNPCQECRKYERKEVIGHWRTGVLFFDGKTFCSVVGLKFVSLIAIQYDRQYPCGLGHERHRNVKNPFLSS